MKNRQNNAKRKSYSKKILWRKYKKENAKNGIERETDEKNISPLKKMPKTGLIDRQQAKTKIISKKWNYEETGQEKQTTIQKQWE